LTALVTTEFSAEVITKKALFNRHDISLQYLFHANDSSTQWDAMSLSTN